jgi:hypothetical protein
MTTSDWYSSLMAGEAIAENPFGVEAYRPRENRALLSAYLAAGGKLSNWISGDNAKAMKGEFSNAIVP